MAVVIGQGLHPRDGDVVEPCLDEAAAAELVDGDVREDVAVVKQPPVLVGPVGAAGRAVVVVQEADLVVLGGVSQVPPELQVSRLQGLGRVLPGRSGVVVGLQGDDLVAVAGGPVAGGAELVLVLLGPSPEDGVDHDADLHGDSQLALVARYGP